MKKYTSPEMKALYFNSSEDILILSEVGGTSPEEMLDKEIRGDSETPIIWG